MRWLLPHRARIAGALLSLLLGCGGKQGTISLNIVVSPIDDPFASAAQVRFTLGDSTHIATVPVSGGHFNFKLDQKPTNMMGVITVEALDGAGQLIAHGQTPQLSLAALDQGPIAVWVGRPGQIAAAPATLPWARSEMAAAPVPGLGVVYAGGRDANEAATNTSAVYDVFTHQTIETATMTAARAGAVAVAALGVRAVVFGGAQAAGAGATGTSLNSAELFDPTEGHGLWAAVPNAPSFAPRSAPQLTVLAGGAGLVTGGADDSGQPLASAALITTAGAAHVDAISGPMVAPRLGHAAAPAHFPSGDGALLVGGLASAGAGPIAERLIGQAFTAYDVPGVDNRIGATATTLQSGAVLILGGSIAGAKAVASGAAIVPSDPAGVTPLPSALSVPRVDHSATVVGNDVLVCGGADAAGHALSTCDLIDGTTYALKTTLNLAAPRQGHSALALETGPVVIAGGRGSDGAPLSTIEIYTP
jgi:hypothetical protein